MDRNRYALPGGMTHGCAGAALPAALVAVLAFLFVLLPASAWETVDYAQVHVGAGSAFMVTGTQQVSAQERARQIDSRINEILRNSRLDPQKITVEPGASGEPQIVLGDMAIATVTGADARVFGTSTGELASRWADIIRDRATQLQPLMSKAGKIDVKVLNEHRVLLLILQVGILLLAACSCGEIMARLGQPPIIGQMLAGILLGQSVFGSLFPGITAVVFPVEQTQSYLLEVVSWLGVIFLLMLTGMETDLGLIRRQGRPALVTCLGGLVVPLALGMGLAYVLPAHLFLDPEKHVLVGIFLGTVLAVSSVPVIAKILMDMNLLRRNVGQMVVAGALIHDVAGCMILAVMAALADTKGDHQASLLVAPLGTLAFVAVAYFGRRWVFSLIRWVNDKSRIEDALLSVVAILLLFSAATTQFLGVHVVLGAFAVGVLLAQSPLIGERVIYPLKAVTMGIFAPIFFAAAGLNINLSVLFNPELLLITVLFSLMACLSKIAGCYAGGKLGGLGLWESLSVGFGTNGRGAMGLIVGILGFSLGVITVEMLSIVMVMSIVTTALTPVLLRYGLKHVKVSEEEQTRLDQEEKQQGTFITQVRRVLLPSGGGGHGRVLSHVLNAIGSYHNIEATALQVQGNGKGTAEADKEKFQSIAAVVNPDRVTLVPRVVEADSPVHGILEEARLGYDLVLLGTQARREKREHVFSRLVDEVARDSPCPVLAVRGTRSSGELKLERLLIPTSGMEDSLRAAEFALAVASATGARVTCLGVVETAAELSGRRRQEAVQLAREIVSNVVALAEAFEVTVEAMVRTQEHAAPEIVRVAGQVGADFIVLGASARPAKLLFLGHTVDYVLDNADCAVAVLKS